MSTISSLNNAAVPDENTPNNASTMPDESTPEGIAVRRKMYHEWELADLATLGPCPPHLRQTTVDIHQSDGFISRTILVHPVGVSTNESIKCPLIIYIH